MGLAVAAGFRQAGLAPPRDLTVMAIRAEESTWFPASYIGSRAAFGRLTPEELDLPGRPVRGRRPLSQPVAAPVRAGIAGALPEAA
jgi:N-carbamoyl-L-amino-acid hydrolase